jgi:peptide/nickel transport system substrate-binding protein
MDPHYHALAANQTVSAHMFETLVDIDPATGKLNPALALSWHALDESTWEFTLRRGVKFHDGGELTAADVVASFERPAGMLNSPGGYTTYTRQIVEKTIVDPYTLRIRMAVPYAILPGAATSIFIVPSRTAAFGPDDFNSGRAMTGTGRYRFRSWTRGERVELIRNPDYWGEQAEWDTVILRMLATPQARIAAMLAGDVDGIEVVPPADVTMLKTRPNIEVVTAVSKRLVFLQADVERDITPYVTDNDGKPLPHNPLKDLRVRRALSMAIDRNAIASRVMEGLATPSGQLLPAGSYGFNPTMQPERYDPASAIKLLAEAGYPQGFKMTMHCPAGRYVNDEKIFHSIAQMFARIGIRSSIEASPAGIYFLRLGKRDASLMMAGLGGTGSPAGFLRSLLATYNADKGNGMYNYSRYSNASVDALIEQAYRTVDQVAAEKLWQQATAIAIGELGLIPLHHQLAIWATRRGFHYHARADEKTLAWEFVSIR